MADDFNYGDPFPGKAASKDIDVKAYELFLVWPVFLQPSRDNRGKLRDSKLDPTKHDFLNRWVAHICATGVWKPREEPYPPRDGPDAAPAYSEFIYFHPFVRQFLYTTRDDIRVFQRSEEGNRLSLEDQLKRAPNRNLRILERDDCKQLKVLMDQTGNVETTFAIKTLWLYVFDTQVALLEMRLLHEHTTARLTLEYVLNMNDCVRRAFAAYWSIWRNKEKTELGHSAGHCPFELKLIKKNNEEVSSRFGAFIAADAKDETRTRLERACYSEFGEVAQVVNAHLEHVYHHREQYAIPLFQELLKPIGPTTLEESRPLRFEQILDERVPIFAYLAVDDPRRISAGDWVRLATIDDAGDSQTFSYSPKFLTPDFLKDYFYDRFWDDSGVKPAQEKWQRTRWLLCGYGFVGVGAADDQDFFANAHSGALAHFRHHYFALGMIAHFHRASLLRFKHALAEAAEKLHDTKDRSAGMRLFRQRLEPLQHDFLRFRTRYWFAEISNQVQGREMFDLWKKHLNTPALFADVAGDIEAADQILRQEQEDQRNALLQRIGIATTILAVLSPALTFVPDAWKGASPVFIVAAVLFILLIAIILCGDKLWASWKENQDGEL